MIRSMLPARRSRRASGGFTLAELLVTIAIIGILAGIVLGALQIARESARASRTRAIIAKLHDIVITHVEGYHDRRLAEPTQRLSASDRGRRDTMAAIRLRILWEFQRMEMPDTYLDLDPDDVIDSNGTMTHRAGPPESPQKDALRLSEYGAAPTVWHTYRGRFQDNQPTTEFASAECLYMFVSVNYPDQLKTFPDTEIGDIDGDGMPEFLDAWGNPIYFVRWPVAFCSTDIQPAVVSDAWLLGQDWSASGRPGLADLWTTDDTVKASKKKFAKEDPDPFDPFHVARGLTEPAGWRVVPLIFSPGPDGVYDINSFQACVDNTAGNANPDLSYYNAGHPYAAPLGLPYDLQTISTASGGGDTGQNQRLDHTDNIHNHRLEVR